METKQVKAIVWIGSSRKDVKEFPKTVREDIGYALFRAQEGDKHHNTKPLTGLNEVLEIVSSYQTDTYRAIYAVKLGNKIYVLHAFKKKSPTGKKTPKPDIEMIKKRFREAQILAKEEK